MAIGASVGKGGINELADVLVVQHLLNGWLTATGQELVPTTGICGPLTIDAIKAFQSRVLGAASPDGRIDPGGRTWQALTTRGTAPAPQPGGTPAPLSGAVWWQANQARFPNSASVSALAPPFREKVAAFIDALGDAGATVRVTATLRNATRAHLMHYCWRIAHGSVAPKDVPAVAGCAIQWDHGDLARSKKGAQEMVDLFGIAFQPSLTSLHIEGRAIDMTIGWTGTIKVRDKSGSPRTVSTPRSGNTNKDLHAIGKTYGVIKLASDPPHWSDNGH
ncbi:peptidoglycan-binding domain-containing protein [Sphingomonas sp. Root241]|uniref:peptidoglycan-binding domain-containing protein n=1 Tax=Sphingomonas sp. Root241 TaxID=1736501 RepID=UPI000A6131FA|nr:peptidoglycan-binding domain-containing protein [Sphingomonas sp. Root241]